MACVFSGSFDNFGFQDHDTVELNAPSNYISVRFRYNPALDTAPFLPMDDLHVQSTGSSPVTYRWLVPVSSSDPSGRNTRVFTSIEEHMFYRHVNAEHYNPSFTGLRGQNVVAEYESVTLRCTFKNGAVVDIDDFEHYQHPDNIATWEHYKSVPFYPLEFHHSDESDAPVYQVLGDYDPAYVHPFLHKVHVRLGTWFGGVSLSDNISRENTFMSEISTVTLVLKVRLWTINDQLKHKTGNYFATSQYIDGSYDVAYSSSIVQEFLYVKHRDQPSYMKYSSSSDTILDYKGTKVVNDPSYDYTAGSKRHMTQSEFEEKFFVCYPSTEGPVPLDRPYGNSALRVIFRKNVKGLGFPLRMDWYKNQARTQFDVLWSPVPVFVPSGSGERQSYRSDYWAVSGAWHFGNAEEDRVDVYTVNYIPGFGSDLNPFERYTQEYIGGCDYNGNTKNVYVPAECFFDGDDRDASKLPSGISLSGNGKRIVLESDYQTTHFCSFMAIDIRFRQEDDSYPTQSFTGSLEMQRKLSFDVGLIGGSQLGADEGSIIPNFDTTSGVSPIESQLVWHRKDVPVYEASNFYARCTQAYVTQTGDIFKYQYRDASVSPSIQFQIWANKARNVGYRIILEDPDGNVTSSVVFPTAPGSYKSTATVGFNLNAPDLVSNLDGYAGTLKIYARTGVDATTESLLRTFEVYFVGEYYENITPSVTSVYITGSDPEKVVRIDTSPATSFIDALNAECSNDEIAEIELDDHTLTITQVATGRCTVRVWSTIYPASSALITVISGTTEPGGADDEPDDYTDYPEPTDPEDPLEPEARAQHAYFYDMDWRTSQLKQHCGGFDHGIGRGQTFNAAPGTLYIVYSEHSKREYFRDGVRTEGMEDQAGKYIPTPLLQGGDVWHTDYEAPAFLDTGNIADRNGTSNKRFREVQYILALDGDTNMDVAFAFLVDGAMRRPMFKPVAVYDPDTDTITVSTEYDEPYSVAESTVGALGTWELDSHTLENAERVRVRQNVTGKGITASTRIVFKMSGQFKLLGVNYVYREMYSR